jgi:hypothetical protein
VYGDFILLTPSYKNIYSLFQKNASKLNKYKVFEEICIATSYFFSGILIVQF